MALPATQQKSSAITLPFLAQDQEEVVEIKSMPHPLQAKQARMMVAMLPVRKEKTLLRMIFLFKERFMKLIRVALFSVVLSTSCSEPDLAYTVKIISIDTYGNSGRGYCFYG